MSEQAQLRHTPSGPKLLAVADIYDHYALAAWKVTTENIGQFRFRSRTPILYKETGENTGQLGLLVTIGKHGKKERTTDAKQEMASESSPQLSLAGVYLQIKGKTPGK